MASLTAQRRVATHVQAIRGMPRENQVKMLTNRAMLMKYEQAMKKKKLPAKDALAYAMGEVFAGAFTKEHTEGSPYDFLCTPENIAVADAALNGEGVAGGKREVIVPSVGKLQHMLKDMRPHEVTAMLALEQEGVNEEKEPRAHVLKLLGDRVMNDMKKADKPTLSAKEIAERKKLLEDD